MANKPIRPQTQLTKPSNVELQSFKPSNPPKHWKPKNPQLPQPYSKLLRGLEGFCISSFEDLEVGIQNVALLSLDC